jgi:hypothetical protein
MDIWIAKRNLVAKSLILQCLIGNQKPGDSPAPIWQPAQATEHPDYLGHSTY